ncbi:translation initiation factor eIF-2B subunit alpha-like [Triticum aestivum]|uniref:translation initiation factor eIF-2B subunit alpha-like n=1 Tax=Triticum aestivum TaxID=4565 RepID=UPI001D00BCC9|nr:translation initiation factor eIF-2B subunit alpha-like [Triticum aestivum]
MAEAETPGIAGCLDRWTKEGADEAVAAVMALLDAVRSSKAETIAGLQADVKAAAEELKRLDSEPYGALSAVCDMFVRYVRRGGVADDQPAQFPALKRRLVGRATRSGDICRGARGAIATLCQDFLLDGCTVLVHGHSPCLCGGRDVDFGDVPVPAGVDVEAPARDYTQSKYLELLITDLGVLQPAAVSDVLLHLSM